MSNTPCAPFTVLVSIGALMTTSDANRALNSSLVAPVSMATRNGCFDMACIPLASLARVRRTAPVRVKVSSGRVIPRVSWHAVADCSALLLAEDFECGERAIGDSALFELSIGSVREQLQALELVPFDGPLPSQESGVLVELAFENIFAGIVAIA